LSLRVLRGGALLFGLLLYTARTASAQVLYAGLGVGPTAVLGEGEGNRNWFGMVGYQSRGHLGGRLSGAETAERLWLSGDLTYQVQVGEHALRPYALLGVGYVLDFSEDDALITAGAGLRFQLSGLLFVFGEVKLHDIIGTPSADPETILPITLGLGVGR
jgi:hypothetical protein